MELDDCIIFENDVYGCNLQKDKNVFMSEYLLLLYSKL